MANLTLKGATSGDVTLTVPAVAGTNTVTIPAATGTVSLLSGGGTLTAGYIPYGNGTSTFGSSANLFWDATNSRLGIGTTGPAFNLEVQGSTAVIQAKSTTSGNGANLILDAAGSTSYPGMTLRQSGVSIWSVQQRADTNLYLYRESGSGDVLIPSGNVGIGTASPSYRLQAKGAAGAQGYIAINDGTGDTTVSGVTAASLLFQARDTSVRTIAQIDAVNSTTNGTGGYLVFQTRISDTLAPAMTLDASGNLLVGTTSVGVGKTTIYSATNTQAAIDGRITASGDVGTRALYLSKFDNNSTTSQILVQFAMNNGATGQGQINADGANTAAFGSYSDARLKKNIVDLPSQLSNILALRPREFDYIESEGGGHQIGFVAQEMQTVYPDAVGERADGMLTITAWSKTEARLVKAIQELSTKLDAAEARIASLEGAK